eukprot:4029766-Prorocentrum_lima.AAC.1
MSSCDCMKTSNRGIAPSTASPCPREKETYSEETRRISSCSWSWKYQASLWTMCWTPVISNEPPG